MLGFKYRLSSILETLSWIYLQKDKIKFFLHCLRSFGASTFILCVHLWLSVLQKCSTTWYKCLIQNQNCSTNKKSARKNDRLTLWETLGTFPIYLISPPWLLSFCLSPAHRRCERRNQGGEPRREEGKQQAFREMRNPLLWAVILKRRPLQ